MARSVVIEFLGKDKSLGKTVDGVDGKTSRLGGKLAKFGKVAALGFAAAAAGAVVVGKKLVDAGERAGTSNARIENIASSMNLFGEEAGKVSGRLVKLAEATARQTGMDQNAIKETQAKLLTFKDLAKSADEVGGSFDRATQAAVDMEAAGFGNASSNAVQLGKALNDPIKGITALAKSGVTFTEVEKERIKTLVESGKAGKAQAMILKAIETQVGGTAEATANGTDKMKVVFSQLTEQIGMKLVPVVDKFANWLVNVGMPAAIRFGKVLQERLGPVVRWLGDIFGKARDALAKAFGGMSKDTGGSLKTIKGVIRDFTVIVRALWDRFGASIIKNLKTVWKVVGVVVKGALKILGGLFKVFSGILTGDWKKVWRGVQDILRGAFRIIVAVVKGALSILKTVMRAAWGVVRDIVRGAWSGLVDIVRNGASRLVDGIAAIPGRIARLAGSFASAGRQIIGAFVDGLRNAAGVVAGIASNVWTALRSMLNSAIGRINRALEFTIRVGPKSFGINPPDIPMLAKGGIVTRPTLAMIGEAGPEAVIPLTGRNAPSAVAGDFTARISLDLNMDGKTIQTKLLTLKRRNGGVALGLA